MPRKKLKPTKEQRLQVKSLAAVGMKHHEIARSAGVSEKTLQKYFKDELFRGPLEANAKVGKTMLEMATSGQKPVATICWLKCRSGWNEHQDGEARPAATPDFVVALEKKAA